MLKVNFLFLILQTVIEKNNNNVRCSISCRCVYMMYFRSTKMKKN